MAVSKVVLAKLSPTMEEGTIVKWNKNEGDPVKQGDVLAEIETDKANMEMEAQGSGILRKILVPAGGKAPVGSLIGVLATIAGTLATKGYPVWIAWLVPILAGIAVNTCQGVLIAYARIPAIVVTLTHLP